MKSALFTLLLPALVASFAPQQVVRPLQSKIFSSVRPYQSKTFSSQCSDDCSPISSIVESAKKGLAGSVLSLMVMTNMCQLLPPDMTVANAAGSTLVGEIAGSGLVFKDKLVVEQFDDPKVQGVSLYISNFQKPMTEKIAKGDLFSDPSFASVACARTGEPIKIADNIAKGKQGEEVFEESKSLLFKTLRVQRIYDEERGVVVYVSFNTRLDKGSDDNKARFKSSTCAIGLN